MRGFEHFGAKQDGRSLSRNIKIETCYTDKVPRVTRIIYKCLSVPLPGSARQSQAMQEVVQLQDVKNTIAFTQPITYDQYQYGPLVGDEQFEAAASRLQRMDDERSTTRGSSRVVPKADLKSLYVHSASAPEEAPQASDFAPAFVTSKFRGSENYAPWDVFETWCSDCPPFIFLFFQLWASTFAPTAADPSPGQEGSSLPISTANLLCLLNIANFKSEVRSRYRFHENELQLQLDLQAFTLVADLATKPELDEIELQKKIMAKDWFHLLLIPGEDLKAKKSAGGMRSRLIVAFLSPLG